MTAVLRRKESLLCRNLDQIELLTSRITIQSHMGLAWQTTMSKTPKEELMSEGDQVSRLIKINNTWVLRNFRDHSCQTPNYLRWFLKLRSANKKQQTSIKAFRFQWAWLKCLWCFLAPFLLCSIRTQWTIKISKTWQLPNSSWTRTWPKVRSPKVLEASRATVVFRKFS